MPLLTVPTTSGIFNLLEPFADLLPEKGFFELDLLFGLVVDFSGESVFHQSVMPAFAALVAKTSAKQNIARVRKAFMAQAPRKVIQRTASIACIQHMISAEVRWAADYRRSGVIRPGKFGRQVVLAQHWALRGPVAGRSALT